MILDHTSCLIPIKRIKNNIPFTKELLAVEIVHDIFSISRILELDKAITTLDIDLTDLTIVLEETFEITIPGVTSKTTNIDTG